MPALRCVVKVTRMKHAFDTWVAETGLAGIGVGYAFLSKTDRVSMHTSTVLRRWRTTAGSHVCLGPHVPRKGVVEQEYGPRMLLKTIMLGGDTTELL